MGSVKYMNGLGNLTIYVSTVTRKHIFLLHNHPVMVTSPIISILSCFQLHLIILNAESQKPHRREHFCALWKFLHIFTRLAINNVKKKKLSLQSEKFSDSMNNFQTV